MTLLATHTRSAVRLIAANVAFLLLVSSADAQAPPAAPLPPPIPFTQALEKAAGDVLQNANIPAGTRVTLLIDPLVDGNSGAQSASTRSMEARIRQLVGTRFAASYDIKPFTTDNLAQNPHVLIGTFTPILATAPAAGQVAAKRDAYRLCFAIIDLKSKLIVSKGFARSTVAGINAVPVPAFADSPVWMKDPPVDGYVKTCQGPKAGDPINPVYLERINAAAAISDAIQAYDNRQYARALDLYTKARALTGGEQLRVLNGLYLANLKLNRKAAADKAFGELVDYGLKGESLGVMMLFNKNTTGFAATPISQSYASWIKAIGDKAAAQKACLEVVGHASLTGTEAFNDQLSAQRAAAIRQRLVQASPGLASSVKSSGKGFRETIVGTGRDDATDSVDRRVEFKVNKCA